MESVDNSITVSFFTRNIKGLKLASKERLYMLQWQQ